MSHKKNANKAHILWERKCFLHTLCIATYGTDNLDEVNRAKNVILKRDIDDIRNYLEKEATTQGAINSNNL